jgi:hypothetical protein
MPDHRSGGGKLAARKAADAYAHCASRFSLMTRAWAIHDWNGLPIPARVLAGGPVEHVGDLNRWDLVTGWRWNAQAISAGP